MRKIFIIASLFFAASASAQNLSVFNLDATNFPTLKASFYAFDANGQQQSPSPNEITVTEDGIQRTVTSVTCPPKKDPAPITLGIMVDTYSGIDLAKEGAQKLINLLSIPPSEAGITMMDHGAFIVQDLTQKQSKLTTAIAKLEPAPGVDLQTMFYAPNAGGVPFVSGRPNKKALVLISDLHCPIYNLNKSQLLADCASQNISVYVVLLNTNDYSGYFKDITSNTGGKLFEKISTSAELDNVIGMIYNNAVNILPCQISWQSNVSCTSDARNVQFSWSNLSSNLSYTLPINAIAGLQFSPQSLYIRSKPVGVKFDTMVSITAINSAFSVTNITSTNPSYDINPKTFSLNKGETKTLTISYTPPDSSYTWTRFDIATDLCAQTYYASASNPGHKPTLPTLELTSPNGGEIYLTSSDTLITWKGIPLTDTVKLEYSTNAGSSWNFITDKATGGKYAWHVPETVSDRCLVKVIFLVNPLNAVITLRGHTASLTSVAFNRDGNKVATSAGDYTGRIWDANSGMLIEVLKGFASYPYISDITWRPDDSGLVTCDGRTGYMWDDNTPTGGYLYWGTSIFRYSPNLKYFIIEGDGIDVYDWNPPGPYRFTYKRSQTDAVSPAEWSPNSLRIASAGGYYKDTTKIWDPITGSVFRSLPTLTSYSFIYDIAWSPDGNRLAVSEGGGVSVWDVNTGRILNVIDTQELFSNNKSDDRSASWSPDGQLLAIANGSNNTASIVDAFTGEVIFKLIGHTNAVTRIRWSSDGGKIATVSDDSTAKIWNLNAEVPITLSDTSESLFSIIAPTFSFSANTIDMGQAETGKEKDSLVKATICNSGNMPLHVLGIDVTGGATTEFMIMSGAGDFMLAPGECRDVMFTFMPMMTGNMSATVTLRTANGNYPDTIKITGVGIAPDLSVMSNVIDFGQVKIGSFKDTTITVAIQNVGNLPINFQPATQLGPDIKQFSMQSSNTPFMLAPNSSQSVTLRFSPRYIGRTSGRIAFDYNGPSSPAILNVFGQGLGGLVSIADDSGYAGDHKNIPMILGKVSVSSIQSEATNFSARIAYDRTVLYPSSGSIQHGNRFDTVTVSGSIGSDSILSNLPFIAMLGESTTSPMNLVDFAWLDGTGKPADFDVETESGTFYMLGICPAGGNRSDNPDGQVSMAHINPNPANGIIHIEIQTTETGRIQLYLMNLLGQKIATISDGELKPGSHSFDFNSQSLSAGSYFLTFVTPTVRRIERVDIEK